MVSSNLDIYAITVFKPTISPNLTSTYPFTSYSDGCGAGGAYTDLFESARQILQLIRDNHKVTIEEIWDRDQTKSRQIISIGWTFDLVPPQFTGTVFIDGPYDDWVEMNKILNQQTQTKLQTIKEQLAGIRQQIVEWTQWKKLHGFYDESDHINPTILVGQDMYIKDVSKWLCEDNVERIKQVFESGSYTHFLLGDKLWDPDALVPHLTRFDANPLDDFGGWCRDSSALTVCAYHNAIQCAHYLLKQGANPHYRNGGGSTPLHLAVRYDYDELVGLLLQAGASPGLMNNAHETVYRVAQKRQSVKSMKLLGMIESE